ncbi:MAG: hypothetical protein H6Q64_727 [Firmicutes bacterium]|nr:hypothetical protein [Bacillota bacterium]
MKIYRFSNGIQRFENYNLASDINREVQNKNGENQGFFSKSKCQEIQC